MPAYLHMGRAFNNIFSGFFMDYPGPVLYFENPCYETNCLHRLSRGASF
jgi:hypothetical protein